jgi:hypothetical protein
VDHPSGVQAVEIAEYMGFNLGTAFVALWEGELEKALTHLQRLDRQPYPLPHVGPMTFREIMAVRRHVFNRPSPWCEPVRYAMAALCNMCASEHFGEKARISKQVIGCVETAIADEKCMGRAMEP